MGWGDFSSRCRENLGCLQILNFIQSSGGTEPRLLSKSANLVSLNKYFMSYWTSQFVTNSVDFFFNGSSSPFRSHASYSVP
jgi:hypothetical protein